jgi:hypothetical protein
LDIYSNNDQEKQLMMMMGNDDQLGAFQSRCEGKKNKKNKKKDFRA